jgi:hypothetical protein
MNINLPLATDAGSIYRKLDIIDPVLLYNSILEII